MVFHAKCVPVGRNHRAAGPRDSGFTIEMSHLLDRSEGFND